MMDPKVFEANVENAEICDEFVLIDGWLDVAAEELGTSAAQLKVDGFLTQTIEHLFFREDLREAGIQNGQAYFSICLPNLLECKPKHISVSVLLSDHKSRFFSDVPTTEFKPKGVIEEITDRIAIGWLFDPRLKAGTAAAFLYNNGRKYPVQPSLQRLDIPHLNKLDAIWGFQVNLDDANGEIAENESYPHDAVSTLISGSQIVYKYLESARSNPTKGISENLAKKRLIRYIRYEAIGSEENAQADMSIVPRLFKGSIQGRRKQIAVVSWDLAHNPAGRSFILAAMAGREYDVSLLGPLFPRFGSRLWGPIAEMRNVVIHTFRGEKLGRYVDICLKIVMENNPDLVYISKPRLPSILLGVMFWKIKGIPVVLDIDDHELAFTTDQKVSSMEKLMLEISSLKLRDQQPYDDVFTHLCDALIPFFPHRTVSNPALQKKYGGVVVRHGRDETLFRLDWNRRREMRQKNGIREEDVVFAFIGTPRPHKGVLKIAECMSRVARDDCVLMILGTFDNQQFRKSIESLPNLRLILIEDQPWGELQNFTSIADVVPLIQDVNSPISQYQIPAKISDALGLGIRVIAPRAAPFFDLIQAGVIDEIDDDALDDMVRGAIRLEDEIPERIVLRTSVFQGEFSYNINSSRIRAIVEVALEERQSPADQINLFWESIVTVAQPQIQQTLEQFSMKGYRPRGNLTGKIDIVAFWKQNDTSIYGRRHEMLLKYLLLSGRVRKILQFDRCCSVRELNQNVESTHNGVQLGQGNLVYANIVRQALEVADEGNLHRRTFVTRDGAEPQELFGRQLPARSEYASYVETQMFSLGIDASECLCIVFPTVFDFPTINERLHFRNILCDIVDDQRMWEAKDSYAEKVVKNYQEVLSAADWVTANCQKVKDGFKSLSNDIEVIPNGAEISTIASDLPIEYAGIEGPIICYVGNLRDRIDVDLIKKLASAETSYHIYLIGAVRPESTIASLPSEFANIKLLGVRTYSHAKSYIEHCSVAIMPHSNTALSENMNPLKLYVYAALGKPIVTTKVANIDDIAPFAMVTKSTEEFIDGVRAQVDLVKSGRQVPFSVPSSVLWKTRIDHLLQHLGMVEDHA